MNKKSALEYALLAGGGIRRSLCFDIHDNLKDISGVQGSVDSSQAAGSDQGVGTATGNLEASDEASISNSGNVDVTNNTLDPAAIAAAESIALSGLGVGEFGLQTGQAAFNAANQTDQEAVTAALNLAAQEQTGGLTNFIQPVLIFGAVLAGIFVVYKIFEAALGGGKKEKAA